MSVELRVAGVPYGDKITAVLRFSNMPNLADTRRSQTDMVIKQARG